MTQLHLQAHPFFGIERVTHVAPKGLTIRQMLEHAADGVEISEALHVVVKRGGHSHEVPGALWDKLRPKEGTAILVTRMPEDGDTFRTIAMIAVMAFATWVTAGGAAAWFGAAFAKGTIGAAVLGATVTTLGMLAVNAAFPPPTPEAMEQGGRWNAITGTNNAFTPNGPIPQVVGSARFYPPHAATPYSETVGETSYHYYLFDLGHLTDDAVVSDIKIGETAITAYDEVEYNVTTTPTIYTSDVSEASVTATLEDPEEPDPPTWIERTTAAGIDKWSVDLWFQGGLYGIGTSGKDFEMEVYFDIEVRSPATSGSWVALTSLSGIRLSGIVETGDPAEPYMVRRNNKNPFAVGIAGDLSAPGQVDIRVARVRSQYGGEDNTHVDACTWTVLRSITNTNPSTTGTTKLEMRIKATDQLSGQLSTLSCMVEQAVPVYDPDTETWTDTLTSNTAWVTYWLMTACPAVKRHAPASRMDLATWTDYADFCTANSLTTHSVLDSDTTMGAYVKDVLANSLARPSYTLTGKYTVLFDDGTKTAEGGFTTLESGNLRWSRVFVERAHAIKVRYRNPDANWDWDTQIVLDDGYSLNGIGPRGEASSDPEPTIYEEMELRHAANAQQAWMVVRLAMGQARHQAAVASFGTDIAGMNYTRGNVVTVENDVMEWGVGSGFVREVVGTTVRLDRQIETTADLAYTAQVRRVESGAQVLESYAVTPHSILTDTFYFGSTPTGLAEGDTVMIGETGREVATVMLTNRSPEEEKHYGFTAVAYSPQVAAYWADPPASIPTNITGTTGEPPDPPTIVDPVSDPDGDDTDNAGIPTTTVRIVVAQPGGYVGGRKSRVTAHEVRWRVAGADPSSGYKYAEVPAYTPINLRGLVPGSAYEIGVRNLGALPSGWTTTTHTVATTNRQGTAALPPVSFGNATSRWVSGVEVDWTATDTAATITWSGGYLKIGETAIGYQPASVDVTGTASEVKTFHLYIADPHLQGGARTLGATTDPVSSMSGYGYIYVATVTVTFDAAGGTGTSGGGETGGGVPGTGTITPYEP